ncbi:MAG: cytochrome c oxidase accessory protein CcoG [Kiritimatiellae bacterium]|nr:cytochrome c oxidase accessory protein CcoG [Kiritimatiellia bacterium]
MARLKSENQQTAETFRDIIPTADRTGKRIWVFSREPKGRYYTWRKLVAWALLAIMFVGPFVSIKGNPLLMFNLVERRFSIFGQMFWPSDIFIFAVCMIIFFVMIALFTAVFGRIWCGWMCPQTVLMEMVFRRIEYFIDGDSHAQKKLSAAPWTWKKIAKRALKYGIFFLVSFIIGNWLLMYIIGWREVWTIISDNPLNHLRGLSAMLAFTGVFFLIFARFREQACTFVCPYGRFQSALVDSNSLIVSYDPKRGEQRGAFKRTQPLDVRRSMGLGDCTDCGLCVDVCPTGVDIRNGLQMECVHCTACIDACDSVMDRLKLPRGLIRYASQEGINTGKPFRFTPRMIGYCGVLILLTAFLGYLLLSRTDVQATPLLRMPGQVYTQLPGDWIQNVYLTKVRNKARGPLPITLKVLEPEGGRVMLQGGREIPPGELVQLAIPVQLPAQALQNGHRDVVVGLYSGEQLIQRMKTGFTGPAGSGAQ